MKQLMIFLQALLYTFIVGLTAFSQDKKNRGVSPTPKESGSFKTEIPAHTYDIILSRPTDHSIAMSILSNDTIYGSILYGLDKTNLNKKSKRYMFSNQKATLVELDSLEGDKRYYYQFVFNEHITGKPESSALHFFQTQRSKETAFTFTIQADSHLDENTSTEIYQQTLANMAADSADFMIDLGDTWMTDKYRQNYLESLKQYIAQRYYLGELCKSTSLYLTLGNHDGESGQLLKRQGQADVSAWATKTRNTFYYNPVPDKFYAGNEDRKNTAGFIGDYYSWEWGNALFIVLDPFRYTNDNRVPWQRSLGKEQYDWLKQVLAKSKAKFKFVFIHNLVGGLDMGGVARGGVEAAKYFEWGGLDLNGENTFQKNRINWDLPIHSLLVANKVNVVFHGHDHFFAKQELDHIVYQLLPQPGGTTYQTNNSVNEYGYTAGVILNKPGYLRVRVTSTNCLVEFVQTSVDHMHNNKEILCTYQIN